MNDKNTLSIIEISIDFGWLLIATVVVQHGVLKIVISGPGLLVAGRHRFCTVVQRDDGGTAIVLHHRESVLELDPVLGQFVVYVTAYVNRHRPVPGQQDARQVPRAGRFLSAVQKHCPRVLTVQYKRVVNSFI